MFYVAISLFNRLISVLKKSRQIIAEHISAAGNESHTPSKPAILGSRISKGMSAITWRNSDSKAAFQATPMA